MNIQQWIITNPWPTFFIFLYLIVTFTQIVNFGILKLIRRLFKKKPVNSTPQDKINTNRSDEVGKAKQEDEDFIHERQSSTKSPFVSPAKPLIKNNDGYVELG